MWRLSDFQARSSRKETRDLSKVDSVNQLRSRTWLARRPVACSLRSKSWQVASMLVFNSGVGAGKTLASQREFGWLLVALQIG